MKTTDKHTLSNLYYDCMELNADVGCAVIAKAQAEGRALTDKESMQLRVTDLDQYALRRKWIDQRREEGGRVVDYETLTMPKRLNVVNVGGMRPQLFLYGDIGEAYGGITAEDFRQQLDAFSDDADIELRVHSDGGSYFDGLAMRSQIAQRKGRTYGVVDGLAASASTLPLMACKKVTMTQGSWMMIHGVQATLSGNADKFHEAIERIEKHNDDIYAAYRPRWTGTEKELRDALRVDTWLSAESAVRLGLADEISDTVAIAASVKGSRFGYKNTPSELQIAAKVADRCYLNRWRAELMIHRAFCWDC